jgi:hypothetical protein
MCTCITLFIASCSEQQVTGYQHARNFIPDPDAEGDGEVS